MSEEKRHIKAGILSRAKTLYVFMSVVVLVICGRLVNLQFNQTVSNHSKAIHEGIFSQKPLKAYRGSILDRYGNPLAMSVIRKAVSVEFGSEALDDEAFERLSYTFDEGVDSLTRDMAVRFKGDRQMDLPKELRGKSAHELAAIMRAERKLRQSNRRDSTEVVPMTRMAKFFGQDDRKVVRTIYDYKPMPLFEVDHNEWLELRKWPIFAQRAYRVEDEDRRLYPYGNLAMRTIGRDNDNLELEYGIEYSYRSVLKGTDGSREMQLITHGTECRVPGSRDDRPNDGADVVTTLDMDVQDVAVKALRKRLEESDAWFGCCVVMEVKTGDVLAIANLGRPFKSRGGYSERFNYAFALPMEPGSTFKLAAALALLDDIGLIPETCYETKKHTFPGTTRAVRDDHAIRSDYKGNNIPAGGKIDMRTAFAQSSNLYFTHAIYNAYIRNPVRYERFLRDELHLGQSLGLEKFEEVAPSIHNLSVKPYKNQLPTQIVGMAYGYALTMAPIHTLTLYNAIANNGRMVAPRIVKRIERDGIELEEFPVRVIDERICTPQTLDIVRGFMEETTISGTARRYLDPKVVPFTSGAKTGTATVDMHFEGRHIVYDDKVYLGSMVSYLPADKPRYTIITAICKQRQGSNDYDYYGAGLAGPVQKSVSMFLYNRDMNRSDFESDAQHERCDKKLATTTVVEGRMPNVVGMGLAEALYTLESCGLDVATKGAGKVVRQSIASGTQIKGGAKVTIELK